MYTKELQLTLELLRAAYMQFEPGSPAAVVITLPDTVGITVFSVIYLNMNLNSYRLKFCTASGLLLTAFLYLENTGAYVYYGYYQVPVFYQHRD